MAPRAARAQQGERMRRIGVLEPIAVDDPEALARVTAFAQGCSSWAGPLSGFNSSRISNPQDADVRFLDRHIESSKIGHAALLLLMLEAADADLVSPSA